MASTRMGIIGVQDVGAEGWNPGPVSNHGRTSPCLDSFSGRRPSPALVISLIALFVSLGGSGYAALTISGKNIKNESITGKDVKRGLPRSAGT